LLKTLKYTRLGFYQKHAKIVICLLGRGITECNMEVLLISFCSTYWFTICWNSWKTYQQMQFF